MDWLIILSIILATILASTLCGYLFFKEKLSKRQISGLVLGIIALALI